MVQHEKSYVIFLQNWQTKSFRLSLAHPEERCSSSSTIRIPCAPLATLRCKKYLFPWYCTQNPHIGFARATQTILSRCLCHKTGIGGFSPVNANLQLWVLCSDLLKKLLEAELQTGPCFVAKCFQSCFIFAVFGCFFLRK